MAAGLDCSQTTLPCNSAKLWSDVRGVGGENTAKKPNYRNSKPNQTRVTLRPAASHTGAGGGTQGGGLHAPAAGQGDERGEEHRQVGAHGARGGPGPPFPSRNNAATRGRFGPSAGGLTSGSRGRRLRQCDHCIIQSTQFTMAPVVGSWTGGARAVECPPPQWASSHGQQMGGCTACPWTHLVPPGEGRGQLFPRSKATHSPTTSEKTTRPSILMRDWITEGLGDSSPLPPKHQAAGPPSGRWRRSGCCSAWCGRRLCGRSR